MLVGDSFYLKEQLLKEISHLIDNLDRAPFDKNKKFDILLVIKIIIMLVIVSNNDYGC